MQKPLSCRSRSVRVTGAGLNAKSQTRKLNCVTLQRFLRNWARFFPQEFSRKRFSLHPCSLRRPWQCFVTSEKAALWPRSEKNVLYPITSKLETRLNDNKNTWSFIHRSFQFENRKISGNHENTTQQLWHQISTTDEIKWNERQKTKNNKMN